MTYYTRYKSYDIRNARKALGWTQATLGAKSGFNRGTVLYWEKKSGLISGVAVDRFVTVLSEAGQVMDKKPLEPPKRCSAKTRKGSPCQCKPLPGKARCKFHGGLSTGPKTKEGIERIRQAQLARWQKHRAKLAA